MARVQIRINGATWHSEIAPWTPPTYSFDLRGCRDASWGFYMRPGERHPALVRGALVELMYGPAVIWSGVIADVDWPGGQVTCNGIALEAARYPSLDGSGNASANPTTVATANQARGWLITAVDSSVPNTDYTATADGSADQTALFDANSDELAQRWYVGADRVLRFAADPTTPTHHIRPKVIDLGLASDEYVSTVFVRYQTSGGTYATQACTDAAVEARFGFRGLLHDVTAYGAITSTRAQDIGNGILAKGRARLGWTSTLELTATELLTPGDMPADLTTVEGGRTLIRVFGIFDEWQWLQGRTYLDVLVDVSTYQAGAPTITLAPLGKVAETPEEIAEEQTLMILGVPPGG